MLLRQVRRTGCVRGDGKISYYITSPKVRVSERISPYQELSNRLSDLLSS